MKKGGDPFKRLNSSFSREQELFDIDIIYIFDIDTR